MLFEIKGEDNSTILEALQAFQREAETEYRAELINAQKKVKAIQSISPVTINVPLPDELSMLSFEKDGVVFLRVGLYAPRIIRVMRKGRDMEKNLKKFLEQRGLKNLKVKWVEEENA